MSQFLENTPRGELTKRNNSNNTTTTTTTTNNNNNKNNKNNNNNDIINNNNTINKHYNNNRDADNNNDNMINGKISNDQEASAKLLAVNDSGMECSDDDVVPDVKITVTEATVCHANVSSSKQSLRSKGKRQSTKDSFRSSNWKLKYKDFLPTSQGSSKKFEKPEKWAMSSCHFSKLVDNVNDWMRKNTQVQVKSCQTVLWTSGDPSALENSYQMVISRSTTENSVTYCKRGLRVWLEPRASRQSSQTLCFVDFVPDKKATTLPQLIEKLNSKIANKQLKGRLVTIETPSYPCDENHKVDTKRTKWTEPTNDDVKYASILRCFYVKDAYSDDMKVDQNSNVGIKNLIPIATECGYEAFECLVERANDWLRNQSNYHVINIQSVIVKKDPDAPSDLETGNNCFFTMPGLNATEPVDFFRILRIAYVVFSSANEQNLPTVFPFTYETFTPEIIREKDSDEDRLETMPETYSKVMAFLRNTGVDVINAEMVYYPMQLYTQQNNLHNCDELNFLYTIRLYLTGQCTMAEGYERSIKRGSVISTASRRNGAKKPNTVRSGPIFLRSVVNRQYKYRWLILAITAISCMSIIVVVSVVYSNQASAKESGNV